MGDFSNYKKFENVGISSSNDTLIVMDSSNNNISLHSSDGEDDNVDTLSIKNIINKTPNMDLNLSSLNGTTINPVITINNNHNDCRINTNLNVSGNLNISENLHISNQLNSTVSTGIPPFYVNSTTTVPNLKVATTGVADITNSVTTAAINGAFLSSLNNWINNGASALGTSVVDQYQEIKLLSGLIMRFGIKSQWTSNSTGFVNYGPGISTILNIQLTGIRTNYTTYAITLQEPPPMANLHNMTFPSNTFLIWKAHAGYEGVYWFLIGIPSNLPL